MEDHAMDLERYAMMLCGECGCNIENNEHSPDCSQTLLVDAHRAIFAVEGLPSVGEGFSADWIRRSDVLQILRCLRLR